MRSNGKYDLNKQQLPIKEFMANNMGALIKWKLGAAFNAYGIEDNNSQGLFKKCPCDNTTTLTQSHVERCRIYDRVWTLMALDEDLRKDELIDKIKSI